MPLCHLAFCRPVRFGGVSMEASDQVKGGESCTWRRGHNADKVVGQKKSSEMVARMQDIIYVL